MPTLNSHVRKSVAALSLACAAMVGAATDVPAQPEPSFRSTCGELRQRLRQLDAEDESLIVIEVVGPLTLVQSDGTLAYMAVCSSPDPQVLCVTYKIDDRRIGDVVVLSGAFSQRGPDHVLLDPCLHFTPDKDG